MLDLRCSESVAREQRASGMREHETSVVEELEMKAAKLSESIAAGEKAVTNAKLNEKDCISAADRATKDLSKAEQTLQKLRIKASDLLGEGKSPC
jgi:exonuclease VII small subunit